MNIKIKRVYDHPDHTDGTRILVDRLWPRGLTKEKAHIDMWLKDIAPSNELRHWFAHETDKWDAFKNRYLRELEDNEEQVSIVKQQLKKGTVTFVYGAKDQKHNQALVLKELFSND